MKPQAVVLLVMLMATPAVADDLAPVALNSLSAAPAAIVSAQVFDEHGKAIGYVQKIVADQDGKPAAIGFAANGTSRLTIISAAAVSYDEQKNILITDASIQ